ncbi:MAG TPA: hypothetical protein VIV60_25245 [Polyangiaceae bacterium]
MKRLLHRIICLSLLAAPAGCGESEPAAKLDEPTVKLLSIEVKSTGESLEIGELRTVRVARAKAPMDSLGGNLMLVSYGGGKVRQAIPFRLPDVLYLEGALDESQPVGEEVAISGGSVTLFLDATEPLERVDVLDENASVVASIGNQELRRAALSANLDTRSLLEATPPEHMSPFERLKSEFPQIRFMDPAAGDSLPAIFYIRPEFKRLVGINDQEADTLVAGLRRLPLTALRAVRGVGVAEMDIASGYVGVSFGGSMLVAQHVLARPEKRDYMVGTISHEATHNFQFLVNGRVPSTINPDTWPPDVLAEADRTVAKYSLHAGVSSAWAEIQDTGVVLGVAGTYDSSDTWKAMSNATAAKLGFASRYGSTKPDEDMAEYVFHLHVPEAHGDGLICQPIRSAGDPFPSELAIPLAKVKFLEGLGLLDSTDVTKCVGNPRITGPTGIHLGGSIDFTSSLKSGWLDQDGGHFLAVSAKGAPYSFLLRILAPDDQVLGLHRLDEVGYFNINRPNNAVYLSHDDNSLKARTSSGGLVLVTAVNAALVEGAIFALSLRGPLGTTTDTFALSTFSVPQ